MHTVVSCSDAGRRVIDVDGSPNLSIVDATPHAGSIADAKIRVDLTSAVNAELAWKDERNGQPFLRPNWKKIFFV